MKDRKERLEDTLGKEIKIVSYSARTYYNLQELFFNIITSCPEDRTWIFNGLKNFNVDDFLPEEVKNQILKLTNNNMSNKRSFFKRIQNGKNI